MLYGQHLRRGHHRSLIPALNGIEKGSDGHDRLARTDLALDQALHRVGACQVMVYLPGDPLLRGMYVRVRGEHLILGRPDGDAPGA